MYDVNEMPPQVDRELLDLLMQCRTESIGHYREWGCAHGSLAAVMPERRVVGTAVPLAFSAMALGADPVEGGLARRA